MNHVELPELPIEGDEHTDKDITYKEAMLASHEITPKNRLENQIRLATDLFEKINHEVDYHDREHRNEIMLFWSADTDEEGNTKMSYSTAYRKIEEEVGLSDGSEMISNHPRIKKITDITVDDILYYIENQKVPEN